MTVYVVRYNGTVIGVCSSRRKAEEMGRIIEEYDDVPMESRGMFIDIDEYRLDVYKHIRI